MNIFKNILTSRRFDDPSYNIHGWRQYMTRFNYSYTYCVWISSDSTIVHIYEFEPFEFNKSVFIGEFYPVRVFIGKSEWSPMTIVSDGYGSKFDGNSILLCIEDRKYIYIGKNMYSFTSENEIIQYLSPIGNNDIPYPYAIDLEGYYYLMVENACMKIREGEEDPYSHYYNIIKYISVYANIENIDIDGEKYKLTTHPSPSSNYEDLIQQLGSPIYIQYKDEEKTEIDKDNFIQLLSDYNNTIGLRPIPDIYIIEKPYTCCGFIIG